MFLATKKSHLSEKEDNLSDKEKEEETESNPSTLATMPLIGFFLSLNTSWRILPRLKAIGGQFNLFYLVLWNWFCLTLNHSVCLLILKFILISKRYLRPAVPGKTRYNVQCTRFKVKHIHTCFFHHTRHINLFAMSETGQFFEIWMKWIIQL